MSDHVDRAAEVIYVEGMGLTAYSPTAVEDHNRHSYRGDCDCNHNDRRAARMTAQALDAAGLLATHAHDAAVAARAWDEGHTAGVRNASAEFDGPVQDNPYKREAGASDADT